MASPARRIRRRRRELAGELVELSSLEVVSLLELVERCAVSSGRSADHCDGPPNEQRSGDEVQRDDEGNAQDDQARRMRHDGQAHRSPLSVRRAMRSRSLSIRATRRRKDRERQNPSK
jgi:hypothetical protein